MYPQKQKLLTFIFKELVPLRPENGLEKNWTGGQLKKILSVACRLLDVFKADFSNYQFAIDFLRLLVAFRCMYQSLYGKILMPHWRENAISFLDLLQKFIAPSCNIGLIQFHSVLHTMNICQKYELGAGSLGLDQNIEALHSVVSSDILPNVEKIQSISNSDTFDKDNQAPDSYIERFRSIHTRQLEMSLQSTPLKQITVDHFDYLKTITIDKAFVMRFEKISLDSGLLTKLTSAKLQKLQK